VRASCFHRHSALQSAQCAWWPELCDEVQRALSGAYRDCSLCSCLRQACWQSRRSLVKACFKLLEHRCCDRERESTACPLPRACRWYSRMTVVDVCVSAVFRRQPAGILRPIALFVTIAVVFLSCPRQVIAHVPVFDSVNVSVQHTLLIQHH